MKKVSKILVIISLCLITFTGGSYGNGSVSFENYSKVYASNSVANQKKIKNLAIFIKFNNSDANVSNHIDDETGVSNAEKIYNSESFEMNTVNGIISVPSFKKYYEMQSYGQLSITTEILPKSNGKVVAYEDTHPIGYYLKYSDINTIGYKTQDEARVREEELINNATSYVANNIGSLGITSNDLDVDNNGIVDAISFVVEGQKNLPSPISWNDLLWSHMKSNTGIKSTILGKNVVSYTLLYANDYTEAASLFSLNRGTYGTIIHEFGHTLGFMDLYRYGSTENPVGFYDIMGKTVGSNPQNLLTYNVSEYNAQTSWHSIISVIDKTTNGITLSKPQFIDKNEKRAIKIQINENSKEYFIVEYYSKQNTYDSYTSDASGIIVYRVNDNNKSYGNTSGGTNGEKDHIFVFRPNETSLGAGAGELTKATLNLNRPKMGKKLDLNNTSFDNESIYYADGTNSGIIITVTGETSSTVTFNVTFPEVDGSGTVSDPYLISDAKTFLYFMEMGTSGKYYKLVSDLDFSSVSSYPKLNFYGSLDGNNKTIRNVKTSYGLFYNIGDFGKSSSVTNLNVENITVTGNGDYLGGFASVISNATIKNVHMKSGQVKNIESLNSFASTGGFAGNVSNDVTIENCSSYLSVNSPKNVGGFIGINQNAIINNSFTSSNVSGSENVGTFIGLQSIADDVYNIPQNVIYEIKVAGNTKTVGGYSAFHNLKALDANSLGKGIIGVSVPSQVEIAANASINYPITINPSSSLNYAVSVSDSTIIQYASNKIVGKKGGNAKVYVDFTIGSIKMRLTTNVVVKASSTTTTTKPTTTTTKPTTTTKKPTTTTTKRPITTTTKKPTTTTTKKPTTTTKKPTTTTKKPTTTTKKPTTTTKKPTTTTKKPTTTTKKPTTTKPTNKVIAITSVKINQKSLTVVTGKTGKLTATINPSNTTQSKALTWSSSNTKIATVDKNGVVKGIKKGTANITVKTSNGKTATVKVTVTNPVKIKSVKLNKKTLKLELGKSATVKATINPSNTTDSKTLTWSTSNKKVATVDKNGKITAKGAGKATITVKTSNGKKATVKVTVSKINAKKATITAIKNQTQTGKSLKPAVQVKLNGKVLRNGKDYTVTYKNNKKAGKATVTVKFKGNYTGSKTGSFLIIPSKVNIKNPSTAKKSITVKYSKVSGAKSYQVAYRLKGTNKWSYTTKSKISKLTSGKEYEVMIRAGIKSGRKTLYGAWSNTKVIKVK